MPQFASPGRLMGPRGGSAAYLPPTPSDYDGTNDFQTRGADLTGISDGQVGTALFFVRPDGGDGGIRTLIGLGSNDVRVQLNASNRFFFAARNAAGTGILELTSDTTYLAGAAWRSVLASWDLGATTPVGHLYVDDVEDLQAGATLTDDTIDYAGQADWGFGGYPSGIVPWNGCLSVCWVDFANYYDLSVEANRRKFVSAENKPANLGANGSNPGTTPIIFTDNGDLTDNKGTGGDFTTTGSLGACSSNPGT